MNTVTNSLQEHKKAGKTISIQSFQEFLKNASKRSKIQIDSDLANARITPTESYRDFYLRIKNLVRMGFPNADEATLEKIAIREFRTKVPHFVRNNVNFRTCQADSVILVDIAQSINDAIKNQANESNFFRTNNFRGRNQTSNRGNSRGNSRGNFRGTYFRGNNFRGYPRPHFNNNSMTANFKEISIQDQFIIQIIRQDQIFMGVHQVKISEVKIGQIEIYSALIVKNTATLHETGSYHRNTPVESKMALTRKNNV